MMPDAQNRLITQQKYGFLGIDAKHLTDYSATNTSANLKGFFSAGKLTCFVFECDSCTHIHKELQQEKKSQQNKCGYNQCYRQNDPGNAQNNLNYLEEQLHFRAFRTADPIRTNRDSLTFGEFVGNHFSSDSGPVQLCTAYWTFLNPMCYPCTAGWAIIPHQEPPLLIIA